MTQKSEAIENYLKAIYQLAENREAGHVSSGEIAKRLGVAPGTATLMLQRLAEQGLVRYEAYSGAKLTRKGKGIALTMLRRHRLIELFLVTSLEMPWDEVHDEAERLEHAVSDQLIERIDVYLGRPDVDPHGAPIPRHDGSLPKTEEVIPLDVCRPETRFVVKQVPDQTPDFLRYLSDVGIEVGSQGVVATNCPQSGVLSIVVNGSEIAISQNSAKSLHVATRG